jgi:hypothetical protein
MDAYMDASMTTQQHPCRLRLISPRLRHLSPITQDACSLGHTMPLGFSHGTHTATIARVLMTTSVLHTDLSMSVSPPATELGMHKGMLRLMSLTCATALLWSAKSTASNVCVCV